MGSLDDILGKGKKQSQEIIEVDGICEECFWPLDRGTYDAKNKKLTIVCSNEHVRTIDWDMNG